MIATLGIAPWTYVPYCFVNLINPVISAFYGFTGITMHRLEEGEGKGKGEGEGEGEATASPEP